MHFYTHKRIPQSIMIQTSICDRTLKDLLGLANEYGILRLKAVRAAYFSEGALSLPDVVNCYKEWRDTSEHIILAYTEEYDMGLGPIRTYTEDCYLCIKASKKGNDVYKSLLKKKWRQVQELNDVTFFKENWGVKKTSMLSVTLTYNTSRSPVEAAWITHGEEWHLFLAKLKQEYGDVEFIRVWESGKNFYPHCHAVIVFKEHQFQVWEQKNNDDSRKWRISDKDTAKIGSFWHSFADVSAVSDTGLALSHLAKYLTKDLMSEKGDKTNAMTWLFRKQTYAISHKFFALINAQLAPELMKEPSTGDLITNVLANCNKDFELIGIWPSRLLKLESTKWYHIMKKPPPGVLVFIRTEYLKRLDHF